MSKKTTKKVKTTAQGNIDTGATESEAYVSIRRDASDVNPNVRPKSMLITKIAAALVWLGVFAGIAACVFALLMSKDMLKDKPELDIAKLQSPDSTTIYDSEGNIIIELGLYLRENIEYDEMPTSLIDAFLAIEDSRFYSHFGFDIPRFTQAAITNIKSGDFSQGGSTITMQLIKNSYFQVDAGSDSTIADREGSSGIKRKLQEIVLAIELNQCESKEEVFALFLNKVNFGNKIRGVEKASQYYFGKSARDLSLPESAFLAGIINSPNNFNPYNDLSKNLGVNQYLDPDMEYLENAQTRKNQVLDLMVLHGYITEEEATLAKTVRMEDLLSGLSEKWSEKSEYYQSYIDAVIEEATKKTGLDPYTTSMKIYSNMDQHMQRFVYDIQNGNTDIYFRKPESQNAIVLMNNQNGALIALGGGRDQTEARMFNRATSAYIQPGSTIKPVLEYALAFEWLGWATSYTITDRPIYLYNGHNLVVNANGQPYYGDMLVTEAIARSLNTPAVQALMAVVKERSEEEVVDYMKQIGFDVEYEDFDLQFAIGGNRLVVTPVQLAGAHGMLINKGKYVEPHTINYIEFADGSKYIADTEGKQVLSPGAAYLAAYCEEYNVSGPFYNYMQILRSDYPVFAKTGTTDWGKAGLSYGIPQGAAKDAWLVCQTSNYTVTIWIGFDQVGEGHYFTLTDDRLNTKGQIGRMMLDELYDYYQHEPVMVERPDDIVEITHIKGVYPYCYPTAGTPVTGLIKEEFAVLTDLSKVPREEKKGVLAGMGVSFGDGDDLNIVWQGFGGGGGGDTVDISATNIYGETTHATGRSYFNRYIFINPSTYYADIYVNGNLHHSISSGSPTYTASVHVDSGSTVTVCGYTSSSSEQKCGDATK